MGGYGASRRYASGKSKDTMPRIFARSLLPVGNSWVPHAREREEPDSLIQNSGKA